MDSIVEGYFSENENEVDPSFVRSIKCNELIHREKTDYQEVIVLKNNVLGTCLFLDSAIQLSEFDEFAYQEMISFLPLNSHSNPAKVLIIGGGDGGVAREVLKHPRVESVTMCEIDQAVIDVSKKFLPFMSKSFDNPKLNLIVGDGYEYVRNNKNSFDIIITDSSDPIGPAECLFQEEYFKCLHESLKTGGIICSQAESFWYQLPLIKDLYKIGKKIFQTVAYGSIMIPSYPSGQIGFLLACKEKETDFSKPSIIFTRKEIDDLNLRYYTADIHRAAFTLPAFVEKELATI